MSALGLDYHDCSVSFIFQRQNMLHAFQGWPKRTGFLRNKFFLFMHIICLSHCFLMQKLSLTSTLELMPQNAHIVKKRTRKFSQDPLLLVRMKIRKLQNFVYEWSSIFSTVLELAIKSTHIDSCIYKDLKSIEYPEKQILIENVTIKKKYYKIITTCIRNNNIIWKYISLKL